MGQRLSVETSIAFGCKYPNVWYGIFSHTFEHKCHSERTTRWIKLTHFNVNKLLLSPI
jgi:hypothetical protein